MDRTTEPSNPELRSLFERCRADHHAWINGDGSPYALPDDGTILGAIGGSGWGGGQTAERQQMLAAQWRHGTGSVEYVNGGIDGELAWLAVIERSNVQFEFDDRGVERRWDLRVTEVFRRSEWGWERIHRHADPLVDRRSLADVVELQR